MVNLCESTRYNKYLVEKLEEVSSILNEDTSILINLTYFFLQKRKLERFKFMDNTLHELKNIYSSCKDEYIKETMLQLMCSIVMEDIKKYVWITHILSNKDSINKEYYLSIFNNTLFNVENIERCISLNEIEMIITKIDIADFLCKYYLHKKNIDIYLSSNDKIYIDSNKETLCIIE